MKRDAEAAAARARSLDAAAAAWRRGQFPAEPADSALTSGVRSPLGSYVQAALPAPLGAAASGASTARYSLALRTEPDDWVLDPKAATASYNSSLGDASLSDLAAAAALGGVGSVAAQAQLGLPAGRRASLALRAPSGLSSGLSSAETAADAANAAAAAAPSAAALARARAVEAAAAAAAAAAEETSLSLANSFADAAALAEFQARAVLLACGFLSGSKSKTFPALPSFLSQLRPRPQFREASGFLSSPADASTPSPSHAPRPAAESAPRPARGVLPGAARPAERRRGGGYQPWWEDPPEPRTYSGWWSAPQAAQRALPPPPPPPVAAEAAQPEAEPSWPPLAVWMAASVQEAAGSAMVEEARLLPGGGAGAARGEVGSAARGGAVEELCRQLGLRTLLSSDFVVDRRSSLGEDGA